MNAETQQLADRALALPQKDRAELAKRLLLSLEPDDLEEDTEALWAEEIERRAAEADADPSVLIDTREAIESVRASLKRGRSE